ncbi:MAG: sulfite exporter TauE/SafE family protein [Thermomicrobiales bacterium]
MTAWGSQLTLIAELAAVTFLLGLLIGFIGAGGAGVAVAILTALFAVPVHTAIGTAIVAMLFVTLSGAISHVREGNVDLQLGLVVGLAGAAGAVVGAGFSQTLSDRTLGIAAGIALWTLALLVWIRLRITARRDLPTDVDWHNGMQRPGAEWAKGVGIGVSGGAAAALFGVGMAPYLQLGFLTVHRLPLRQTVGTTMLTLVFISASGGIAMARHGDVSPPHLIGLTAGLASGAYLGARFTKRAPKEILRGAVVVVPFVAGAMLLFR